MKYRREATEMIWETWQEISPLAEKASALSRLLFHTVSGTMEPLLHNLDKDSQAVEIIERRILAAAQRILAERQRTSEISNARN